MILTLLDFINNVLFKALAYLTNTSAGTFIVRDSASDASSLVLTYVGAAGGLMHAKIENTPV